MVRCGQSRRKMDVVWRERHFVSCEGLGIGIVQTEVVRSPADRSGRRRPTRARVRPQLGHVRDASSVSLGRGAKSGRNTLLPQVEHSPSSSRPTAAIFCSLHFSSSFSLTTPTLAGQERSCISEMFFKMLSTTYAQLHPSIIIPDILIFVIYDHS